VRRASGFTLIELMIAIVVTGVVALLVYGVIGVALDTRDRVTQRRNNLQREVAFHSVLSEALRCVRQAEPTEPDVFVLEEMADASGRPRDRLSFVTAGGTPPLTADADWRVTLEVTDMGLALAASPEGVATTPVVLAVLNGVSGLDVEVLAPGKLPPRAPGALASLPGAPGLVSVVFWDETGVARPPIVVAPRVGGNP
jgi:prepilin-type N-terminal cleavage/methylation domain-containing protein